jgi:hypothetical protein
MLYALTLSGPVRLTQGEFLHFPGRCFGQSIDKFDALGGLKVGHMIPAEADQVCLTGVLLPA